MWVLFQRVCGFCAVKGDISFVCDLSIQADSLKKKKVQFSWRQKQKNHIILYMKQAYYLRILPEERQWGQKKCTTYWISH